MTTISSFIADNFYYVFLGILFLNLFQRKYREKGNDKRMATLLIAIGIFIIFLGATFIVNSKEIAGIVLNDYYLIIVAALLAFLGWRFQAKVFPFRTKCVECGKKLTSEEVLFIDGNICSSCRNDEAVEGEAEVIDSAETKADETTKIDTESEDSGAESN